MSKKFRYAITFFIVLILGGTIGFYIMKNQTKSLSPEETITYRHDNLKVNVFYNRPYKKEREIFGNLVPYNKVWRTGANEATTFKVNQDIMVDGSLLEAGEYTLWTIPNKDSWKVIFNKKMYAWGIDLTTEDAARNPDYDALTIEVPAREKLNVTEQFTIYFDRQQEMHMLFLTWDKTFIAIPFNKSRGVDTTTEV